MDYVYGMLGGVAGKTIIAPVDRYKLIRQIYGDRINLIQMVQKYNSEFHQPNKKILERVSIFSTLWKGNTLNIVRAGIFASVQLNLFQHLKSQTNVPLASAVSGFVAQTVSFPIDQWRTHWAQKLEFNKANNFKEMFQELRLLIKNKKVMQGYTASLVSSTPFNTINFTLKDFIEKKLILNRLQREHEILENLLWKETEKHKEILQKSLNNKRKNDILLSGLSGSIAAATTVTLLFPLDTIRRSIQVAPQKVSMFEMTRKLLSENQSSLFSSVRRLYCGYIPNVVKSTINYGIRWTVFDAGRS